MARVLAFVFCLIFCAPLWAQTEATSVAGRCSEVLLEATPQHEQPPAPEKSFWDKARNFVQTNWHKLQAKAWQFALHFTSDEKLAHKLSNPPANKRRRALLAREMAERDFRIYENKRILLELAPEEELHILKAHLQKTFRTLLADNHTYTLDQRDQAVQAELRTILHTLPNYTQWTTVHKNNLWQTIASGLWETNPTFALEQTDAQLIIDLHRYCDINHDLSVWELAQHALEPIKTAYIDGPLSSRVQQITEQKEKLLTYAIGLDRLTPEFWASAFQVRSTEVNRRDAAIYTLETLKRALAVTQNHLSRLHLDENQRLELVGVKLVADKLLTPLHRESIRTLMTTFELNPQSNWHKIEPWLDPLHLLELWEAQGVPLKPDELHAKLTSDMHSSDHPEENFLRLTQPLQEFLSRALRDERASFDSLTELINVLEEARLQTSLHVDWKSLKTTIGKKSVPEFLQLVARFPRWFSSTPPADFFRRFKADERAKLQAQFPQAVEVRTPVATPLMAPHKTLVQLFLKLHAAGLTVRFGHPFTRDELELADLSDVSLEQANSISEQANEFYGTTGEQGLQRLETEAEAFYYANLSQAEREEYVLTIFKKLRASRKMTIDSVTLSIMTAAQLRKANVKGVLVSSVKQLNRRAAKLWNVPSGLPHLAKLADTVMRPKPAAPALPKPTPTPESINQFNMYLSLYESASDIAELSRLLKQDGFGADFLEALEYSIEPSLTAFKRAFDAQPKGKKAELRFVDVPAYLRIPFEERERLRAPETVELPPSTVASSPLQAEVSRVKTFDSARMELSITNEALSEHHLPAEVMRYLNERILAAYEPMDVLHAIHALNTLINSDKMRFKDLPNFSQTLFTNEVVFDFFKTKRDVEEAVVFESWKQAREVWTRFQKAWRDPQNTQIIKRQQVASRNGTLVYGFTDEFGQYDVVIKLAQGETGQDVGQVIALKPHQGVVFRPEVLRRSILRMESLYTDWDAAREGRWIDLNTSVYSGIETIGDLGFALKPTSK